MKTRNGFVSNSSSSSFVVAVKKNVNICPHCKRKDINIIELIDQYRHYDESDSTRVIATGWERVKEYEGSCGTDKEEKSRLEAIVKPYLNANWEIAAIKISYHDDITNNLFKEGKESGNIVIIKGDEEE